MQSRTKYFKQDFLFFIFGRGCGWSWEGVNYNSAAEGPSPTPFQKHLCNGAWCVFGSVRRWWWWRCGSRPICSPFLHLSSIAGSGIGQGLQKATEKSHDKRPGVIRARAASPAVCCCSQIILHHLQRRSEMRDKKHFSRAAQLGGVANV